MKTDLNYLSSICEGNQQIINEMIDLFSIQIKEMSADMLKVEKEADYITLSNIAHKAKSTVAIMGMTILSEKLRDLEIMAKEGKNPETYKEQIDFFINESEIGIKELNNYRNTQNKS